MKIPFDSHLTRKQRIFNVLGIPLKYVNASVKGIEFNPIKKIDSSYESITPSKQKKWIKKIATYIKKQDLDKLKSKKIFLYSQPTDNTAFKLASILLIRAYNAGRKIRCLNLDFIKYNEIDKYQEDEFIVLYSVYENSVYKKFDLIRGLLRKFDTSFVMVIGGTRSLLKDGKDPLGIQEFNELHIGYPFDYFIQPYENNKFTRTV